MIFKKIAILFFIATLTANFALPRAVFAAIDTSPSPLPEVPVATPSSSTAAPEPSVPPCTSLLGTLGIMDCNVVPTEQPLGVKRDIANQIAWGIAKMLVHKLTDQIVMMIRTGGQGGGPLFVQDWNGFLLDAADQASGVFIKELNLTQLCEPFAPRLRLIFAGGRQSFQERYRCTVSTVMGNIQSFFNDFNNGGWQRWIELTQVQNNPYGQYLGILEEKEKREALGVQKSFNEAMSANGFLGIPECQEQLPEEHINPNTGATELVPVEPRCKIVSPGKWLEERLVASTNSDIQQLNLADSFNEIILAAFQTMMQTLFSSGGLASSDIHSTAITSQLQNDLDNLKQSMIQFSGIDSAISITQSIVAKKSDSLAKVKDEIITLGKLKTCQVNKNLPVNTTENSANAATSTQLALENNILDQTLFNETLKDDRAALLGATTVDELNQISAKTQNDVAKVGSLGAATLENTAITADKTKAEGDLDKCLNPPPPTSGG